MLEFFVLTCIVLFFDDGAVHVPHVHPAPPHRIRRRYSYSSAETLARHLADEAGSTAAPGTGHPAVPNLMKSVRLRATNPVPGVVLSLSLSLSVLFLAFLLSLSARPSAELFRFVFLSFAFVSVAVVLLCTRWF